MPGESLSRRSDGLEKIWQASGRYGRVATIRSKRKWGSTWGTAALSGNAGMGTANRGCPLRKPRKDMREGRHGQCL